METKAGVVTTEYYDDGMGKGVKILLNGDTVCMLDVMNHQTEGGTRLIVYSDDHDDEPTNIININKTVEENKMSRINNIVNFAQKREMEQAEKEMAKLNRIKEYKERIKALKPRIEELLAVGNACIEHGIELDGKAWGGHEGYDTHQFFSNSWSHLTGFIYEYNQTTRKPMPITKVGIIGGGACHFNLKTDGNIIDVEGDVLYVLGRFVNEFDKFETEFYDYVDKVTKC